MAALAKCGIMRVVGRLDAPHHHQTKLTRPKTVIQELLMPQADERTKHHRHRPQSDPTGSLSAVDFQKLVAQSPMGVAVCDAQGAVLDANPACLRLCGFEDPEEALDTDVFEHLDIPTEFRPRLDRRELVQFETAFPGSLDSPPPPGPPSRQPRYLNVQITPLGLDDDQAPRGYLVHVRDITGRRLAQEALRQSEERYRSLFEESPISLWEEDYSAVKAYLDRLEAAGVSDLPAYLEEHPEAVSECAGLIRVIAVNEATLDLFGAASEEQLIDGLGSIMAEEAYPAFRKQLAAIARREPLPQTETVNRTLDGQRLDLLVDMRVAPGHEETYGRVLVSLMDITERKRMADELRQRDLLAALGQMAAGIAHDFRSLLTTIILHAEMGLRKPGLSQELASHFRVVKEASKEADGLIQQILDFGSKAMLDVERMHLRALVAQVVEELHQTFPKSIDLVIESEPGPFPVSGDRNGLRRAITNLALNARDAMKSADQPVAEGELRFALSHVRVEPEERPVVSTAPHDHPPVLKAGKWVCLAVSDRGCGMPEQVQDHLFEPFFTTKEVGEGKGLGLAQVYGIVRQHEGTIAVESEVGEGTTFRIYLPACGDGPPE